MMLIQSNNRPQAQKVRDQRRRKLAYYNSGGNADQGASSDTTATPKTVSLSSPSLPPYSLGEIVNMKVHVLFVF